MFRELLKPVLFHVYFTLDTFAAFNRGTLIFGKRRRRLRVEGSVVLKIRLVAHVNLVCM